MSAKSTINTSMNFREWGLLLALSILWGCSFFFNGVAVRELPTFTIVVGRVALASLTLLLVMSVAGQQMPRNRRVWLAFGGMGFLNNVAPFCLIVFGDRNWLHLELPQFSMRPHLCLPESLLIL